MDNTCKQTPFDGHRMFGGCMSILAAYATAAIVLAVLALTCGCAPTRYIPVVEHRTDTLRHTVMQHDSVYVHDSVYFSLRTSGDTVYSTEYRQRALVRDRWHTDTLLVVRADTVPSPYPVEKVVEVERKLSTWQRIELWAGRVLLGLLGFAAIIYFIPLKKLK